MIENKNRTRQEDASIAVAEDNRELDWKSKSFMASLFMGELDVRMITPYPQQGADDKAVGDEICARVDAWAKDNLDGEAIDREEQIPAHVWKGLADLGLFGIKIPQKYGGLGLSQTNYMRVLSVVARYCGSTAATLSAHQSIGVPQPLKLFGTEAQKQKYLPRFAKGAISAFALTEPQVGSDPANMSTVATPSADGQTWTISGEKLWCTNGAVADVIVVMARTPSKMKGDREIKQITAFIVDTDTPGVEVVHRCRFMGLRAIENGLIRFHNVVVPSENIIWGEGKGLRLALTTLNDGRLGIPAIAASAAVEIGDFMVGWAKSRAQWGKAIGAHEAGADKVARLISGAYAMEALSTYCAAVSDRGDTDIRMEAAAAKMYNSELSWNLADLALQLRGGRGYETASSLEARGEHGFPMERILRDARINRIVEGTTDVMHLFLAREALDGHLRLAGNLFKKVSLGEKLKTVAQCGLYYAGWYPKQWLGGLTSFFKYGELPGDLGSFMGWVDRRSHKLARTLFHQMLLQGPKLEMRQLTLARVVDIGVELGVMALVVARAASDLRQGDASALAKARHFLCGARLRVDALFAEIGDNVDAEARALAEAALAASPGLPVLTAPELGPIAHDRGVELTSGRCQGRTPLEGEGAAAAR